MPRAEEYMANLALSLLAWSSLGLSNSIDDEILFAFLNLEKSSVAEEEEEEEEEKRPPLTSTCPRDRVNDATDSAAGATTWSGIGVSSTLSQSTAPPVDDEPILVAPSFLAPSLPVPLDLMPMLVPISLGRDDEPPTGASISPQPPNGSLVADALAAPLPDEEEADDVPVLPVIQLTSSLSDLLGEKAAADEDDDEEEEEEEEDNGKEL